MNVPCYLALDIGRRRIGVAVGTTMAFGRGALDARDPDAAMRRLSEIISKQAITDIVVGIPQTESGRPSESLATVNAWIDRMGQAFDLPIHSVNEAYSSREAERQLRATGVDTRRAKDRVDERAAELLLEQYLAQ